MPKSAAKAFVASVSDAMAFLVVDPVSGAVKKLKASAALATALVPGLMSAADFSKLAGIDAGTWTPTVIGESNVTGTSVLSSFYMTIGSIFVFGIRFAATRNSAAATKFVTFSAPPVVTNNFASADDAFASGTYVSTDNTATNVRGNANAGTKTIVCNWQDTASTGTRTFNLLGGGIVP